MTIIIITRKILIFIVNNSSGKLKNNVKNPKQA